MKRREFHAIAALLTFASALPLSAAPVAYVHATFHPISAPDIENGTMVVDEGHIVALGADVRPPEGAQVVDLDGLQVWPGLIDAATNLGLVEIDSVRGTVDTTEIGDFNPDLRTEVAFHPDSRRLLPAIAGGVLTAHVVPDGDLFLGRSAVMRLDGWTWEGMTLAAPVGQHLRFPAMIRPSSPWVHITQEDFDAQRDAKLRRLDELVGTARGYARARAAAEAGEGAPVPVDPKLEALRPLLAGEQPLFLWANEKTQIAKGLDWAAKNGFARLILVAGPDCAYLAERLAHDDVPVLLQGTLRLPDRSWEPYDEAYTAPARLAAAGVRFAMLDTGGGGSENTRNLPFNAAMAVAFGLPRQTALEAMTSAPAAILGISDRVGALTPGLEATFFVSDGSPLDLRSHVRRVFVRGSEVNLERDPQRQLWERYGTRPSAGGN